VFRLPTRVVATDDVTLLIPSHLTGDEDEVTKAHRLCQNA
jgi:hypothetical protein